jgi:hypothetical protein
MSINTKMRLTLIASAFALAAAAPAAFAQSAGTWNQGIHTDPPTGAPDFGGERHSRELMEKKIVPSNVATNTGTWSQGFHTDPSTGAADGAGERHSKELMEKKVVPSNAAPNRYYERVGG